jgi:RNA polymerase sigma factor (sigma-70 family)
MREGPQGAGTRVTKPVRERLFERIVLPHLDDALTLARWITGNRHDAEDVLQDACLRAFSAIERQTILNPRAWFLAIVRNTAMTWLGRNRPRQLLLVEDTDAVAQGDVALADDGPEAEMIAAAEREELQRALAALPSPFREALVLRDINGLSYREIAEVTEVAIGTVMSRIARARSLLMRQLTRATAPSRDAS